MAGRDQVFEILDIGGCNDGTAGQIGDRDRERINRELQPDAGLTEELAGVHACSCIDRAYFDSITPSPADTAASARLP